jgi:hypothetical protein
MNPETITALLELINKAIQLGGEIAPIAINAFNAFKEETGMTDEELIAAAKELNEQDATKLAALLAEA